MQLINAAVLPLLWLQRYNKYKPKSKFLEHLISHLDIFQPLKKCLNLLIYSIFSILFTTYKKMKSGYNILSLADYQNVRFSYVLPHPNATATHIFATDPSIELAHYPHQKRFKPLAMSELEPFLFEFFVKCLSQSTTALIGYFVKARIYVSRSIGLTL